MSILCWLRLVFAYFVLFVYKLNGSECLRWHFTTRRSAIGRENKRKKDNFYSTKLEAVKIVSGRWRSNCSRRSSIVAVHWSRRSSDSPWTRMLDCRAGQNEPVRRFVGAARDSCRVATEWMCCTVVAVWWTLPGVRLCWGRWMDSYWHDWWCPPARIGTAAGYCWRNCRLKTVSVSCRCSTIQFCRWSVSVETAKIRKHTDLLCMDWAPALRANGANEMRRGHWWRRWCARYAYWCLACRGFSGRIDGIAMTECTANQDLEPAHANRRWIEGALDHMRGHCGVEVSVSMRLRAGSLTDLCLFVFGFHSAMAVSLFGLKKIDPSFRLTSKPMPCDDFLPTNRIGSSAPNGNGPARSASVLTENNLQNVAVESEPDQWVQWKLFQFSFARKWFIFFSRSHRPQRVPRTKTSDHFWFT